jgi:hypothetical protein
MDADVNLRLDHVRVLLEKSTDEVLKQLAFRIVERAQLNIRENDQIDTGFMVNSAYAVWKGGSGFSSAEAQAESQARSSGKGHGGRSDRSVIHEELPADADAAVVIGANYAIFQEILKPFLYPAAEAAANEFQGTAEKIYRETLPNE